jgi:hypothetical protein
LEVLNTIQGTPVISLNAFGWVVVVFLFIGVLCLWGGMQEEAPGPALFGFVLTVITICTLVWGPTSSPTGKVTPTKYEVKLTDPNYVIDATKYQVVEKRGEIYVLEDVKQ